MGLLPTVEPHRRQGVHLHREGGRRRDGVVRVGEEGGVEAGRQPDAGLIKGRLGEGVVGGEEGEADDVAEGGADAAGVVDEIGAADLDLDGC